MAAILGGTPNNASRSVGSNARSRRWRMASIGEPAAEREHHDRRHVLGGRRDPGVFQGLLTKNPEIRGYAYEYADGMNTGLKEYEALDIPVENLTLALRTDEQTLFCDWVDRAEPTYQIFYSAGGSSPVSG